MLGGSCSPCCATPTGCDYTQPNLQSVLTISMNSSVYGNAFFSRPAADMGAYDLQGITSKAVAYAGARTTENPQTIKSELWARSYFNRTNTVFPWTDGDLLWARLNNVGVTTFCTRGAFSDTLEQFLRIQFQAYYWAARLNLSVVAHSVDGQQATLTLPNATHSEVNWLILSLPTGFSVESVVIAYEFLEITDPATGSTPQQFISNKSIPLQETLTYRGLYDSSGAQLMYAFADNFELP